MLAHVNNKWISVASEAMAPACSVVDKYKISKEIAPTCYADNQTSRDVSYL